MLNVDTLDVENVILSTVNHNILCIRPDELKAKFVFAAVCRLHLQSTTLFLAFYRYFADKTFYSNCNMFSKIKMLTKLFIEKITYSYQFCHSDLITLSPSNGLLCNKYLFNGSDKFKCTH